MGRWLAAIVGLFVMMAVGCGQTAPSPVSPTATLQSTVSVESTRGANAAARDKVFLRERDSILDSADRYLEMCRKFPTLDLHARVAAESLQKDCDAIPDVRDADELFAQYSMVKHIPAYFRNAAELIRLAEKAELRGNNESRDANLGMAESNLAQIADVLKSLKEMESSRLEMIEYRKKAVPDK